jgi:uncharacterized protein (TIGR00369 family)
MTEERLAELIQLFAERSPIARYFGMKLSFSTDNESTIDLDYNPNLDHSMGAIHGGVYATMLDIAGWFASAAMHDISSWVATSQMSIHFLEAARQTSLQARGRVIKSGKRLDVAEMDLYDGHGILVGRATGTYIVLPKISMA